ncbi:MAG: hypothetical protein KAJ91_04155 [Candidatus Aenigmarchaeota archaeon]|nr:hypothetical protein [Candidatus Aenigmarchaeota archaeon]
MTLFHVLAVGEVVLSGAAGYFFAGMSWESGVLFLFAALVANIRAGKLAKKKQNSFVGIINRISDTLIFTGVAVGTRGFLAPGLFVLFLVVFVPHITCKIRELRGQDSKDVLRKYRIYALMLAGLLETVCFGAIYAGLGAIIGLILMEFVSVLRGKK